MEDQPLGLTLLDRMCRAWELARERLIRATSALERAAVPYAVAGENAVAEWVARGDESAVRGTPHVDLQIRRSDFAAAASILESVGFLQCTALRGAVFTDGPDGSIRSGVYITWAGEYVQPGDPYPAADVTDAEMAKHFRVLRFEALVRMLLTANGRLEGMLARDVIDVGLLDATWLHRLPADLAARLQILLDTPDG